MTFIMQPEKPGQSISVPRCEQRCRDSDEVREDGNGDGEEAGSGGHHETEEDPDRPSEERVGVDVSGVAEETDEDQFGRSVGAQSPSAVLYFGTDRYWLITSASNSDDHGTVQYLHKKIQKGDAEGDFRPDWRKGEKSWGLDGAPDVHVDDSAEDDVEDCRKSLKHPGRLKKRMAV